MLGLKLNHVSKSGHWHRRKSGHQQYGTGSALLDKWAWAWGELSSWWRHQMETFSALLAICAGNSPAPGEFHAQRPVTRSFDVFSDLRPNKRWGNNREPDDLGRHQAHCDVIVMSNIPTPSMQHDVDGKLDASTTLQYCDFIMMNTLNMFLFVMLWCHMLLL